MYTSNNKSILICSCESMEHQIKLVKEDELDHKIVFMTIHLKPGNFWQRLKNGIKYIFGHKSVYGDFDEFIFKEEHADKLIELGNYLKE